MTPADTSNIASVLYAISLVICKYLSVYLSIYLSIHSPHIYILCDLSSWIYVWSRIKRQRKWWNTGRERSHHLGSCCSLLPAAKQQSTTPSDLSPFPVGSLQFSRNLTRHLIRRKSMQPNPMQPWCFLVSPYQTRGMSEHPLILPMKMEWKGE